MWSFHKWDGSWLQIYSLPHKMIRWCYYIHGSKRQRDTKASCNTYVLQNNKCRTMLKQQQFRVYVFALGMQRKKNKPLSSTVGLSFHERLPAFVCTNTNGHGRRDLHSLQWFTVVPGARKMARKRCFAKAKAGSTAWKCYIGSVCSTQLICWALITLL